MAMHDKIVQARHVGDRIEFLALDPRNARGRLHFPLNVVKIELLGGHPNGRGRHFTTRLLGELFCNLSGRKARLTRGFNCCS
jgi:hypothetical protein